MNDPSDELQVAIAGKLKADAAVIAAVTAAKVYNPVPAGAVKPYINLSEPQVLPDKADCVDGAETAITIHGWAVQSGNDSAAKVIHRVGSAIVGALDGADLTLANHRLILCELESLFYLDDPDALTKHVAATFRILTESKN